MAETAQQLEDESLKRKKKTLLDESKHYYLCITLFMYFQGTGEFINTKFFCRVCSMLHDPKAQTEHSSYEDVNEWWRGKGTCINGSWRKFYKALEADAAAKRKKTAGVVVAASAAADGSNSSNGAKEGASVQPPKSSNNDKEVEAGLNTDVAKENPEEKQAKLP